MAGGATALLGVYGLTEFMLPMVLDDLDEEQARARPRGEGGPSIAWTIGHLIYCRVALLNRLGDARENTFGEKFGNVPATDGSDYPSMAELRATWGEVGDDFMAAIAALTEEQLEAVLEDGWHEEQVLRDQVVFFGWHEGYHLGAIGQIRKDLGLLGPAERVMESRRSE